MKKILFLLLFSIFAFGQNVELLKKANGSDSIFTRELSEKIFEGFKIIPATKDDIFDQKRSNVIEYTLENTNSPQKKVYVTFEWFTKGGNSDLNIKGEKYYVFKEATGAFLDMFPFWKKEVQPNANTDKTYETHPTYSYINSKQKVWFNFFRTSSGWIMRNESWRSLPWNDQL
ncbi:hypothetical protein [Elizabethkingia anophelis]|uniref:hypothetical protein n=1 Tax=Elizabethkingia anophelis TaxID=1117645 RepID=UPI003891A91F